MLLRILVVSLSMLTMLCCLPDAEACEKMGCQGRIIEIPAEPASYSSQRDSQVPALADASDEALVRERDLLKLEPPAPEFWMQFRSYAYRQLPKHEKENFAAVWVAMPLATSDGTVPSLVLRGSWW